MINIDPSWKSFFHEEQKKRYYIDIMQFLISEQQQNKTIYPPQEDIFNAFNYCAKNDIKVVIIGQDPYHDKGQAHGLSFSVQPYVKTPPSLRNIYKELSSDIPGFEIPNHGFLKSWAEQGVLLLNTSLTVQAHKPASHSKIGWEIFTDSVIKHINNELDSLVFLLWGSHAQTKSVFIDESKHKILKSAHPSPFSAHRGFLGNKHFSETNKWLKEHNIKEINWQLPNL